MLVVPFSINRYFSMQFITKVNINLMEKKQTYRVRTACALLNVRISTVKVVNAKLQFETINLMKLKYLSWSRNKEGDGLTRKVFTI